MRGRGNTRVVRSAAQRPGHVDDAKSIGDNSQLADAVVGVTVIGVWLFVAAVNTWSAFTEGSLRRALPNAAARKACLAKLSCELFKLGRRGPVQTTRERIAAALPPALAAWPQWQQQARGGGGPCYASPPAVAPELLGLGGGGALDDVALQTGGFTGEQLREVVHVAVALGPLAAVAGQVAALEEAVAAWERGIASRMAAGDSQAVACEAAALLHRAHAVALARR
ncbi:hypothetical protein HYH03_015155 [Edaphochlamys debaryana]|uniref:Uncharacterized protein n=1 Tax=Edaphochlamys debaryana TaxID=47281 RepID=A0A836BSV9_9CHLO|nr:hypothetical protein HYH03_015155 [Edaphochlamys debaryana]|eukprot:KAG2486193.1 hypothetical protein HYH03_015155 [Edaphochlamys debaryana]